jgi:hypothetical protein
MMALLQRPMTVADLRHALDGLPADREVLVDAGVNIDHPAHGTVRGMTVLECREAQHGPTAPVVVLHAEGGVLAW